MAFQPSVIAIDFETSLDGKGSLMTYHDRFRVDSMALTWRNEGGDLASRFVVGEANIADQLAIIAKAGIPCVAHNAQFELACLRARFPSFPLDLLQFDTMRLAQVKDSGGKLEFGPSFEQSLEDILADLEGKRKPKNGLGLEACVRRFLPTAFHDHKAPFHKYLREEQGVRKGKEGENLTLLPFHMLRDYNVADTTNTLLLYEHLTAGLDYDWTFDHGLHLRAAQRIVDFNQRGVAVDTDKLDAAIAVLRGQILQIKLDFRARFADEIGRIEVERGHVWVNSPKTERGQAQRQARLDREGFEALGLAFNPGSTKQLKELFVDVLGHKVEFWTRPQKNRTSEKEFVPSPSFRSTHLGSYGDGGSMLSKLKKLGLVLKQAENLRALAEEDGRWHLNLSATGTKTGRYRGSSDSTPRLNCQGLARRHESMMSCIVADEGKSIISVDLTAGEPTVTAHYSGDANYHALNFGMVGKEPYYTEGGILMMDDMYIAGGSVHPSGKAIVQEAWNSTYNGRTFAEQWVEDKEVLKKELKSHRAAWKTAILALQYGQGARGMVRTAYDNGFTLHYKDAKAFHHAFWHILFPDVRLLGEKITALFKQRGAIINDFGFRMVPESDHKCLNYFIQSTVSGLMKVLEEEFYKRAPYAETLPIIHDEILTQVPDDKVEHARKMMDEAMAEVNKMLGWSIAVRNGFVSGKNFYEAK